MDRSLYEAPEVKHAITREHGNRTYIMAAGRMISRLIVIQRKGGALLYQAAPVRCPVRLKQAFSGSAYHSTRLLMITPRRKNWSGYQGPP
jgi:hypothetical protein